MEKNKTLVREAEKKIDKAIQRMKIGKPSQEGIEYMDSQPDSYIINKSVLEEGK